MSPVEKLLQDEAKLPSPPTIAVRILDVVRRDAFSFPELANVIQTDPALTGRVLRLANSSFYSVSRNVSTLETAVAVMGANVVKNVALSFVLARAFHGPSGERFDFERLWRRSITAAVAAELISKAVGLKTDETFISSLLQDIGIAALAVLRKEDYLTVLTEKALTGLPVTTVEKQVFGFDHQEVGAELLRLWGLPESVYGPIRYHHDIDNAPDPVRNLCMVLWASDRLSAIYHGAGLARHVRTAEEILTQRFALSETGALALIDSVAEKTTDLLGQFRGEEINVMPLSQILQDANAELSRLNLSCQMLLIEYKESVRKAERLAADLKSTTERLRHAAYHDNLSGLYNRQYFQESIGREISRSQRYKHPLSLILFDIDEFKTINDTYGHHCGDEVLKAISRIILGGTRKSDIVVRYGGDEFAILLPETGAANAAIKGDSCRKLIGNTEIEAEGHRIRVTTSVGIAACSPSQPMTVESLIQAADEALYQSKRAGRNRLTVWEPNAG
jgi:diguanylate cyclase (GGDEF)-like protein